MVLFLANKCRSEKELPPHSSNGTRSLQPPARRRARERCYNRAGLVMLGASKFCCLSAHVSAVAAGFAADHKSAQKRIEELLADPDVAKAVWGIEVVDLGSGKTLYSLNADKLFIPASNTKLFTTAAVLALIGPDYRFHTTLESTGTVDRYGRLSGDLVIVGRGDPNLSGRTLPYNLRTERKMPPVRVLEELADQLAGPRGEGDRRRFGGRRLLLHLPALRRRLGAG